MKTAFFIINRPLCELLNPNYVAETPYTVAQMADIISFIVSDPFVEESKPRLYIESDNSQRLGNELTWFKPDEITRLLKSLTHERVIVTSLWDFSPIDYYDFTATAYAAVTFRKNSGYLNLKLDRNQRFVLSTDSSSVYTLGNHLYLQTGLELSIVNSVEMLINQLAEHKIDAYSQGPAINLQELLGEKLNEQLALFRSQTEAEREQDQLLRRYKELIEDV